MNGSSFRFSGSEKIDVLELISELANSFPEGMDEDQELRHLVSSEGVVMDSPDIKRVDMQQELQAALDYAKSEHVAALVKCLMPTGLLCGNLSDTELAQQFQHLVQPDIKK